MNRKKFCTTLLLWKSIGFSSQLSLVSPLAAAVTSVPISSSCVSLSLNVQQNFKCLNLWSLKLRTSSFAQLYFLTAATTTEIVTFYKIGINWPMLRLVKLFVDFWRYRFQGCNHRETGATAVAPKIWDTLTLFQPRGADSAHHHRGRS